MSLYNQTTFINLYLMILIKVAYLQNELSKAPTFYSQPNLIILAFLLHHD
jgi:hypothetical protein